MKNKVIKQKTRGRKTVIDKEDEKEEADRVKQRDERRRGWQ